MKALLPVRMKKPLPARWAERGEWSSDWHCRRQGAVAVTVALALSVSPEGA